MTIQFSFTVILLLVSITAGILGAVILFSEQANKAANKFLGFLLLAAVGPLVHNFLIASGIYDQQPNLYFLPVVYSLGTGPLLYLYVYRLINGHPILPKIIFLHLLPLVLQLSFYTYCFLQSAEEKYVLYTQVFEPYAKGIINLAVYISMACYLYLSFREISLYKQRLKTYYSNDYRIALNWLRRLLFVFMGYYILLLFFIILAGAFHLSQDYFPSDLARGLIIFMIGFFAVRQNSLIEIHKNLQEVSEPVKDVPVAGPGMHDELNTGDNPKDSSRKAGQSLPINEELLTKIIQVTEQHQLYLNEELCIADLAREIGYSTKTISGCINQGLGKSFSLFINEYRVNLFIERKTSGNFEHLSIMGLAYDCGFNSKSSFNRIFKELKGYSPKALTSGGN